MDGETQAFPDTLVGTDSHTTMISGLGVLGYGVGGIEAEAVLLGQPLYQPLPRVVGVRLQGELPRGTTATDLVLVISQMLRKHGVVGAFVEFAGDGLASLALADRATISNMSPEYGATTALFPVDDETLAYLRLTGRDEDLVRLVEAYTKEQGPVALAGRRPRLRRDAGARPRDRGAQRRRAAPAAGPGARGRPRDQLPEHLPARDVQRRCREPAAPVVTEVEEASRESFPASDAPAFGPPTRWMSRDTRTGLPTRTSRRHTRGRPSIDP